MKIIEKPPLPLAQICLYGSSGSGKTALATHLPWGDPRWGERAIYVAIDNSSEKLESIHPEDRKHLIIVSPEPKVVNGRLVLDPHSEAAEIASHDWKSQFSDVGTIILDGGTELADMLLRSYANQGVFSGAGGDKHLMVGQKGTASYMAQPMEGDYGMAQNGMNHILGFLFKQPLSIICVFQEDIYQPKGTAAASAAIGGPVGAGGKSINKLASKFNTVVRCEARSSSIPDAKGQIKNTTQFKVYTEPRGIWLGKLRKPVGMENPIAEMDVTNRIHEFWKAFDGFAVHWMEDTK